MDTEEVAKNLRIVAFRLASPGCGDKSLPVLQKLEEKADTSVWKSLATLVSPKTRYADLKKEKVIPLSYFHYIVIYHSNRLPLSRGIS